MIIQIAFTGQPIADQPPAPNLNWNKRCGGRGSCNACTITLLEGTFDCNGKSLVAGNGATHQAKACQTKLTSQTGLIDIPSLAMQTQDGSISTTFANDAAKPITDTVAAIDLGTTTVAAIKLFPDGTRSTASAFNRQIQFGDNVISRITHASTESGLKQLQLEAAKSLDEVLEKLPDPPPKAIALAANTVMTSIFWGIDTTPIGKAPYMPNVTEFTPKTARELNLDAVPQDTPVFAAPALSGFIGGDVLAGLATLNLNPYELFIDLGTNCEMALALEDGQIVCTTAAAGPAFEGAGISSGRRAVTGAIDHIGPNWTFTTIHNADPIGICGSAMIELLARGRQDGWLTQYGRLVPQALENRLTTLNNIKALKLTDDIIVTELDIEQLLKAKAAVQAGITTLLQDSNLTMQNLSKIYLAGGFAQHLRIDSLFSINLIPPSPSPPAVELLGNTALRGAERLAVNHAFINQIRTLKSRCTDHPLNESIYFEDNYIDSLKLP